MLPLGPTGFGRGGAGLRHEAMRAMRLDWSAIRSHPPASPQPGMHWPAQHAAAGSGPHWTVFSRPRCARFETNVAIGRNAYDASFGRNSRGVDCPRVNQGLYPLYHPPSPHPLILGLARPLLRCEGCGRLWHISLERKSLESGRDDGLPSTRARFGCSARGCSSKEAARGRAGADAVHAQLGVTCKQPPPGAAAERAQYPVPEQGKNYVKQQQSIVDAIIASTDIMIYSYIN